MDRPVLNPLVRELANSERFRAFLGELPETRARVSEAALPLLIAALHEELDRPLVLLGIRRMGQQAQLRGAEAEQRATSPSRLPWTTCAPTAW